MRYQALKAAFPYTIPIFSGFWFLGLAYGIYMRTSGFSFVYPMIMSALIFGGSLEFVAVEMLLSPFAPVQVLIMTLLIQARHLFYGISMLEKYKGLGWKKFFLIFGMCDETFSINYTATIPEHVDRGWFLFFVTLLNFVYWVSGASIGGLAGALSVLLWSGFLYDSGYGCHRRASHPVEKETIAIGGLKSNDTFAANDHHRPVRRRNDVDTFSPVPHIS